MPQSKLKSWAPYAAIAGAVVLTAFAGSQFGPGDWYRALEKPSWTPPNWIFPVAWTTLYAMIAAAGCLLWRTGGLRSPAFRMWIGQLVLNAAWSGIFFGLQRPGWALADIGLLLAAIAATIALAWRRSRAAAWLLAPYLAWVAFATALNVAIWQLNP